MNCLILQGVILPIEKHVLHCRCLSWKQKGLFQATDNVLVVDKLEKLFCSFFIATSMQMQLDFFTSFYINFLTCF